MHHIELTLSADAQLTRVMHAIERFDETALLGPTLERLRNEQPLSIDLDRPDRADRLARRVELLDELDALGATHSLMIHDVPPPRPGSPPARLRPRPASKADLLGELERSRE